jgi:sigma-B regulation protein RsbU (phosphoserine phosphatase)
MNRAKENIGDRALDLRKIGNKQSLSFIIFLSVVCLLIYLFAFYLFSVRGIINEFGLESQRQMLSDHLSLLSLEVARAGGKEISLDELTSDKAFLDKFNFLNMTEIGQPFIFRREDATVFWPSEFDTHVGDIAEEVISEGGKWQLFDYGGGRTVFVHDYLIGRAYFLIAYTGLNDEFHLGVIKNQSEVFQRTNGFERTLSGFLALGFLVFLVFFIAIIKILTNPLKRISDAAKDISRGDYEVKLNPEFTFISEIGELSDSFNEMSKELKRRYDESRAYSVKLQRSNVNLEDALKKLQQKYKELRTLNNISYQLHRMNDADRIVNYALEHIRIHNDLKRAAVYMKEESSGRFVELGASGQQEEMISEDSFNNCVQSANPVVEYETQAGNGNGSKQLILPVELGERRSGVLLLESEGNDDFNEERIDYYSHLTSHIFSIVRNKLLLQDSLKRTEELRRINRISERIAGELDLTRLFNEIARAVRASLGAAACAVLTREPDGIMRTRSVVAVTKAAEELPFNSLGQTVLRLIIESGEPLLISDSQNDQRLEEGSPLTKYGFRSFVGTPMFYQDSLIGIICAIDQTVAAFDERDVSFLSTVGHQTATALENATLFEIIRERDDRRDQQLTVAQKFQRDRIPNYFEKGKIEIHSAILPAEELAGDFFDVFSLAPSTIAFVVGDVATKGIPASLMTFSLLSMFRNDAKTMRSPAKVLETMNQNVISQVKEDTWFTTCFYGKLNTDDLTLVYSKAGHEMPIIHKQDEGKILHLDANGLPLGIYDNTQYEAKQVQLAHRDRLILFTDGVVEAVNNAGERFGRKKLIRVIEKNKDLSAKELAAEIVEQVNLFAEGMKQTDDILVAVLEVKTDPWVRKTIRYSESGPLINEIMDQLKLYDLDNTTTYAVRLSLDESLANAFKHGNKGNEEATIEVSFLITQEKFCLSVKDAGRGFNYEALPDPTVEENLFKSHGRGVFLMRQLLDEVEFNEAGNEINIIKYFPRPEEIEEL